MRYIFPIIFAILSAFLFSQQVEAADPYTCKSAEPNYIGRKVNPDTAKFAATVLPITTSSLSQALRGYVTSSYSPTLQRYWTGRVNTLAQSRRDLIIEVVRYNPNLIGSKANLVSLSSSDQLTLSKITRNCYETEETSDGVLDMAPAGAFTGSAFETQYYMQTNNKIILFLYSANRINPELKPTIRIRVHGFRLDGDLYFDGSNPNNLIIIADMRPQPGSPAAFTPSLSVSSQMQSCTFTRSAVPRQIKSSILAQWIWEASEEEDVPFGILASIAMHESESAVANWNNNDPHIASNNYCNPGQLFGNTRPMGLMQVQSGNFPGMDLCNIQVNIRAGAKVYKWGIPTKAYDNSTLVKKAVCKYFGYSDGRVSCGYPPPNYQYDYAGEVWADYRKCENAPPPVMATVQTDIAGLEGVNGGSVAARGEDTYAVSGQAKATATAVPPQGTPVAGVTFSADGQQFASDSTPPYEASADTKALPDGNHTLSVTGRDVANHTGSDAVTLQVDNTKPAISIAEPSPARGSGPYSGVVLLRPDVSDTGTGIGTVVFLLDGQVFDSTTTAPYQVLGDSTQTTNGWHTLTMRVYDNIGNFNDSSRQVQVWNDDLPPEKVVIKSPLGGANINSWTWFKVDAADKDSGIQKVEFYINGAKVAEDQSNTDDPERLYAYEWHSGQSPYGPGTYTLKAIAYDNSANHIPRESAPVNVTISAPVIPTPTPVDITPPTVSIRQPANNTVTQNWVWIKADATDGQSGVRRVIFYINGSAKYEDFAKDDDPENLYAWEWRVWDPGYGPGTYEVTVRSCDNANNCTTQGQDAVISVTVRDNTAPETVVLTEPTGGTFNGDVRVVAQARDNGIGIDRVYFYVSGPGTNGNILLDPGDEANDNRDDWYSNTWHAGNAQFTGGDYYLSAKARDRRGNEQWSNVVKVSKPSAPAPPPPQDTTPPDRVEIRQPYISGDSTIFTGWFKVYAHDNGVGVAWVDFYLNNNKIGTDSNTGDDPEGLYAIPFHASELATGAYDLKARACDNRTNCRDSVPLGIYVNNSSDLPPASSNPADTTPPTVVVTTPNPSTDRLWSNQNVTISANVTDTQSGIQKVEFYDNGTTLIPGCTKTAAPFTCTYRIGVVPFLGTKKFGVKAYDRAGNASPVVIISVPTWY